MRTGIEYINPAPLATFRIFFGLIMFISIIRFWVNGWIEKLYLDPTFHFKYYGFEWVQVPEPGVLYLLFILCAISSICVALGLWYRGSILTFFLTFTYIELLDKTTYLNHYYLISVLSFALIFIPTASTFSLDSWRQKTNHLVPKFYVNVIRLIIAIVYIYAGLAKLNYDWLINATPLSIWLPSKHQIPFLGEILQDSWIHYAFSWFGAFYDLFIVFFLSYKKTRPFAFASVLVFHLLTAMLFPIGMFPYIMITSTLIFFPIGFHSAVLNYIARLLKIEIEAFSRFSEIKRSPVSRIVLLVFIGIQMLLPLRHLAYPGNLFWTEEGYRFSWRVMLIEKTAYAQFKILDKENNVSFTVDNSDFLTPFQEKQMAMQADFIVEYAHYLGNHYSDKGRKKLEIYVDSYVALNGARSRRFIDQNVDLLEVEDSFYHKNWILPYAE